MFYVHIINNNNFVFSSFRKENELTNEQERERERESEREREIELRKYLI